MSYEVEAIKKQRTNKDGTISFLVKWVGYTRSTWEPEENLGTAEEILAEFKAGQKEEEDSESGASFDEEETYDVEKILAHRLEDSKIFYKIKWLGFEEYAEMEEEQLEGCKGMLEEYKKKHKINEPVNSPRSSRKSKKESSSPRRSSRRERSSSSSSSTYVSPKRLPSPIFDSPKSTRSNSSPKRKAAPSVEVVVLPDDTPQKRTPARRQISLAEGTTQSNGTPAQRGRKRKNQAVATSPKQKAAKGESESASDEDDIEIVDSVIESDTVSEFFAVEEIIDHVTENGETKYHVLWEAGDKTWEPEENLEPAAKMIAAYKKKNMQISEKSTPKATPKNKATPKQMAGASGSLIKEAVAQASSSKTTRSTPRQKAGPSGASVKEIVDITKIGRTLFADVIFKNGDLEKMDMDNLHDIDHTIAYKTMKKKLLSMM